MKRLNIGGLTPLQRWELIELQHRADTLYGGMVDYSCGELDAMSRRQLRRVFKRREPGRRHWWSLPRSQR